MFADLDIASYEVREELKNWALWYLNFTKCDGFRLDAIKHISIEFFNEWLDTIRQQSGKELFTVGEYWQPIVLIYSIVI
jgi:alpha-amylase